MIEKDPDTNQNLQITSDKKYLWDGVEIAEERDSTGANVTKRFYSQGFVDSDGTILLYTRDHLGSVRELVDMQQVVRARYEYDPFGRVTKVSGDRDSDFLYTSHFWHAQSGLTLTFYRAYDPNLGRWLSRDAAEERGGINLYGYVLNNPINLIDPSGLGPWRPVPGSGGWKTRHDPSAGGGDPAHDHYQDPRGRDIDRRVYDDGSQKKHGDGGIDKDVPQDVIDKNPRNKPKKADECPPEPEKAPDVSERTRSPYWRSPLADDWEFSRTPYGPIWDWIKSITPAPPVPSSPNPYSPQCPICGAHH